MGSHMPWCVGGSRSEHNFGCQSLLVGRGAESIVGFCVFEASLPTRFWRVSCLYLPSHRRNSGTAESCYHTPISMGSGNTGSGGLSWVANTLPTRPSPRHH